MTARRLPAPWRVEKIPGGYVVRDANGQALAYVLGGDSMTRKDDVSTWSLKDLNQQINRAGGQALPGGRNRRDLVEQRAADIPRVAGATASAARTLATI
jgi:hypothetical protein